MPSRKQSKQNKKRRRSEIVGLASFKDTMDTARHQVVKLRGIVTSGIQQSAFFTEIPWVRKQFAQKLGINPYPGTFNITVLPADQDKLNQLRESKGIEIVPEDKSFCAATSFHVVINHQVKGAAIIPLVPSYPAAQLEIIAAERIKDALALQDGDLVEIEVYPGGRD